MSFNDEYKSIRIYQPIGRPLKMNFELLKKAYKNRLPVSLSKKTDLLSLCKSGLIRIDFHQFYNDLPVSAHAKNVAPEPSALMYTAFAAQLSPRNILIPLCTQVTPAAPPLERSHPHRPIHIAHQADLTGRPPLSVPGQVL
uniref:Uncharacterized protein n=1 Tax=Romanomermis culicivorax TaxID=13658 RepID=A0A915I908_ROMCU